MEFYHFTRTNQLEFKRNVVEQTIKLLIELLIYGNCGQVISMEVLNNAPVQFSVSVL